MSDKIKFIAFILALICNFTFLATAQNNIREEAKKLPQCIKAFGKDSLKTLNTISAIEDEFKNKDYLNAYRSYTYLYSEAPCAYKNAYIFAPTILSRLIDDSKNTNRKQGLIDTLLLVYPNRIQYFGEDGPVKALWALNIGRYRPEKTMEALKLYQSYIESEKHKIEDVLYVRDYLRQAIVAYKNNQYNQDQLFTLYDQLTEITENYKVKSVTDTPRYKMWNNAALLMDKMMSPYLKCDDIDAIYQAKIKNDPESKDLIVKVIRLYRSAGPLCKENPKFIALLEKSFAIEPNPLAAEELAIYYEKKKDFAKADPFYEKAAELSLNKIKKQVIYLKLANRHLDNISQSKSFVEKVLAINPNNGNAIILQGIILYKTKCGDVFEQSMAACAAVDLFNKAKSIDPTCEKEANIQIANHSKFYPSKTDILAKSLKNGDVYFINCHGISTTIRVQ